MATDSIPQKRAPSTIDGKRKCSKCNDWFPATSEYFELQPNNSLGIGYKCRPCANKYKKQWATDHPSSRSVSRKNWNESNPTYFHDRYFDKREEILPKHRAYYQNNKHWLLPLMRAYKKNYPDKINSINQGRRAREKNAPGKFTDADIQELYRSQKGLCWWCGCKLDPGNYHVDHRIALTRGGTNWPNNLCITCPHCNMSKNDRLPHEWSDRLL